MKMLELTIIRGLPGSGKTTHAKMLGKPYYEADMFFYNSSGDYHWSPEFLREAHSLCRLNVIKSLYDGENVTVSNTFTTLKEIKPYIEIKDMFPDLNINIIEMKSQYKSLHDVPESTIMRMEQRWQEIPKGWDVTVVEVL